MAIVLHVNPMQMSAVVLAVLGAVVVGGVGVGALAQWAGASRAKRFLVAIGLSAGIAALAGVQTGTVRMFYLSCDYIWPFCELMGWG